MGMAIVLFGSIFYISSLLSSPNSSPTQIQKTKAAQLTYTKKIDLVDNFGSDEVTPEITPGDSVIPTIPAPTAVPTLLALAPTVVPTARPTAIPTKTPTVIPTTTIIEPTDLPEPTNLLPSPTLQPLLAYKSTSVTPTLIPIKDTGGMSNPTATITKKMVSPTIKAQQPTGIQNLPESGWIQTSSILFIVATTTILFSLIF